MFAELQHQIRKKLKLLDLGYRYAELNTNGELSMVRKKAVGLD